MPVILRAAILSNMHLYCSDSEVAAVAYRRAESPKKLK